MRIPEYLIKSTVAPTTRFYNISKFFPTSLKKLITDEETADAALNSLIYTDGDKHFINWYILMTITIVMLLLGLLMVFIGCFFKKINNDTFDPFMNSKECSMNDKSIILYFLIFKKF